MKLDRQQFLQMSASESSNSIFSEKERAFVRFNQLCMSFDHYLLKFVVFDQDFFEVEFSYYNFDFMIRTKLHKRQQEEMEHELILTGPNCFHSFLSFHYSSPEADCQKIMSFLLENVNTFETVLNSVNQLASRIEKWREKFAPLGVEVTDTGRVRLFTRINELSDEEIQSLFEVMNKIKK